MKGTINNMRESGILYPIFSLPSRFGIGSFSEEAYKFIDFLEESGQGYWQILPIGPTGYGDSPYQAVSAFAGNPYFVSPEELIKDGLLTWDECGSFDFGNHEERIDYGALYNNRFLLLRKAFDRFLERGLDQGKDYKAFLEKEAYWLDDYSIFMALKQKAKGEGWQTWEKPLRLHEKKALEAAREELSDTVEFFNFIQFKFDQQWKKLHAYATEKKVRIIGDIPFYAALDSVDVWAHPEAFLLDEDRKPTVVAGCAPDAFSKTGQLWGNPIYDWKKMKKDKYGWWMKRFAKSFEIYDVIRIDHFHGFSEYYAVPAEDKTAENGKSHKGPGADFFKVVEKEFGPLNNKDGMKIIAEDLGTVNEENVKLLEDFAIPGMKIIQYAFTSWNSIYLPYKHVRNCVVYTGTHDNMPTMGWLESLTEGERNYVKRYMRSGYDSYGAIVWDLIAECYRSVADLVIIPLQDYLVKGNEARINTPGEATGNWQWRLQPNFLSSQLASDIHELTATYGRTPARVKEIK